MKQFFILPLLLLPFLSTAQNFNVNVMASAKMKEYKNFNLLKETEFDDKMKIVINNQSVTLNKDTYPIVAVGKNNMLPNQYIIFYKVQNKSTAEFTISIEHITYEPDYNEVIQEYEFRDGDYTVFQYNW